MTFIKVLDTIAFILIDLNILPSSVLMALNIAGCRRFNRDTLRHITTPSSRMARALYHHFVIKFCVFHQHFFHVCLARCTHRVFCWILHIPPRLRSSILCAIYILDGASRLSVSLARQSFQRTCLDR
jgi:hypothetical protein